ncbi:MAG: glycosyltransferase family 2 protein [Ectothiorhodospiraceae bacterium]|jgi:glycosyltransferase involved in cell wall biosynthesis|nr:glycosyltransferase family 2 protein [Ectothiorhodospiraceae bacterium]
MTDPLLTIAICTHDRADLVMNALASLGRQTDGSDAWQILVIDNACRDDTTARVERAIRDEPRIGLMHEPRTGLSHARNAAFAHCATPWILYVDDDSTFPPDYVERALRIIRERRPQVFGGPVTPWYQTPPPAWFRDEYGSYSLPHRTGRSQRIFLSGANIGFAVEALRTVGGFAPGLGLQGKARGYGEETDAELRILARYGPDAVWFDPEFVNFHLVRPERYDWRALIAEHVERGRSRARVARGLAAAGTPPTEAIPDCLRPRPQTGRARRPLRWQNLAYDYGLPLLRVLGYASGRLSALGRTRSRDIPA